MTPDGWDLVLDIEAPEAANKARMAKLASLEQPTEDKNSASNGVTFDD